MANKRKGNAAVPRAWGAVEKKFGESIKENLDVLLGHRGSALDRAVTFKDLLDSGALKLASGVTLSNFSGSSGDVEVPAQPGTEYEIPNQPYNLTATAGLELIILEWDLVGYLGHAYVEIFRHTSDSISDATLLARVPSLGGIFTDPVGESATFYYWVRAVNENNDLGPFNSSTGTSATTEASVNRILTTLAGSISESELTTALSTRIDDAETDIQNLTTTYGSTTSAAASAAAAAQSAIDASNDAASAASDALAAGNSASAAAQDAIDTAADVLSTAADALATSGDRAQTLLDRQATAADVITTNADAATTTQKAADALQSAQNAATDAAATAADVLLTAADVQSTNSDALATAADVLSTGADVLATAADAQATAADVLAAANSAGAALASQGVATAQATAASNSAAAALASEGIAAAQATAASNSAAAALISENNASSSETNAAGSAASASTSSTVAAAAQSSAETARDAAIQSAVIIGQESLVEPRDQWTGASQSTATTLIKDPIPTGEGTFVTNDSDFGSAWKFTANTNHTIGPASPIHYEDGRVIEVYVEFKIHSDSQTNNNLTQVKVGVTVNNGTSRLQENAQRFLGSFDVADGVQTFTTWFYSSNAVVPSNLPSGVGNHSITSQTNANYIYPHIRQNSAGDGLMTVGIFRVRDVTEVAEAMKKAEEASTSAGAASTSASQASASETNAGQSAGAASSSANAASTSAGAALASEQAAATSESNALGSANTATTQAGLAATSASNASASEGAALASEQAAATSESNALGSANTATSQAGLASTSASNASASEGAALASEQAAATSESNALGSANTASTQASLASTSASNASTSEANALASESAAATSATNAAGSASSASASSVLAANARKRVSLVDKGASNAGFEEGVVGQGVPSGWIVTAQNNLSNIGFVASVDSNSEFASELSYGTISTSTFNTGHWLSLAKHFLVEPGTTIKVKSKVWLMDVYGGSSSGNPSDPQWIGEDDVVVAFTYYDADGSEISSGYTRGAASKYADANNISTPAALQTAIAQTWFAYESETSTVPSNAEYAKIEIVGVDYNGNVVSNALWGDYTNFNGGNFMGRIDDCEFICTDGSLQEISEGPIDSAVSASAALTSEQAASASETNAGQSASAANSSALAASTSEGNASTSEGNAATSAGNAATSEGNAATSAGNAAASESAALVSETAAATSASNAAGSASSASTSATLAASAQSSSATRNFIRYLDPITTYGSTVTANANPGWRYVTEKTGTTNTTTGSQAYAVLDGAREEPGYDFTQGQKLRVQFYYNSSAAIDNTAVTLRQSATGNLVGSNFITLPYGSSGWVQVNQVITIGGTYTDYCLGFDRITSTGDFLISDFSVTDVSESESASASAAAALLSEQSATADASAAGQSASAANLDAIAASTSAGLASTSESNAATSESNAAGSATTATTQAGLAATSASNASNSAGQAAISATNAATSESNASGSASSASTSSTLAASSANDAKAFQIQTQKQQRGMLAISERIAMLGATYYIAVEEDDTPIYKNGSLLATMDRGQNTSNTFTLAVGDSLTSTKPFNATTSDNVPLASVANAGRWFGLHADRYLPYEVRIYPLADGEAYIRIEEAGTYSYSDFSSVTPVTLTANTMLYQTSVDHSGTGDDGNLAIHTTCDCLVWVRTTSGVDKQLVHPASESIFARPLGTDTMNVIGPNASASNNTVTRKHVSNGPWRHAEDFDTLVWANTIGDGDGTDGATHMPQESLGDEYIFPYHTMHDFYIASFEPNLNVKVFDRTNTEIFDIDVVSAGAGYQEGIASGDNTDPNALNNTDGPFYFTGNQPFYLMVNMSEDEEPLLGYRRDMKQVGTAKGAAIASIHSASEASTSETNAGQSAQTATNQAGAASTSAANALTSEQNASQSETNATGSASAAATSASNAATSENNASTSAGNAATSATQAATSASNAAGSASTAATSSTTAASAQAAAELAQEAAEEARDSVILQSLVADGGAEETDLLLRGTYGQNLTSEGWNTLQWETTSSEAYEGVQSATNISNGIFSDNFADIYTTNIAQVEGESYTWAAWVKKDFNDDIYFVFNQHGGWATGHHRVTGNWEFVTGQGTIPNASASSLPVQLDMRGHDTASSGNVYIDGLRIFRGLKQLDRTLTLGSSWVKSGVTENTGISDPVGGTSAYEFTGIDSGDYGFVQAISPIKAGETYEASYYVKDVVGTIQIRIARSSGGAFESSVFSLPSSTGVWTKVCVSHTFANDHNGARVDFIGHSGVSNGSFKLYNPQLRQVDMLPYDDTAKTASFKAVTSADAAITSAQQASASNTSAGQEAAAAAASALAASTSESNASASESSAASSATNASGSASTASSQATLAATARTGAENARDLALSELAASGPSRFNPILENWVRNSYDNNLLSTDDRFISDDGMSATYFTINDAEFGDAYIFTNVGTNETVGPARAYPYGSDKVYFIRVIYRVTTDSTLSYSSGAMNTYIGATTRGEDGTTMYENWQPFYSHKQVSDGVSELSGVIHGEDYAASLIGGLSVVSDLNITNTNNATASQLSTTTLSSQNGSMTDAVSIGFHIRQNAGGSSDGRLAVKSYEVIDITNVVKAEIEADNASTSAAAALVSEGNASASETAAGQSASTATTQALAASTSAGAALASEQAAASSETNAQGSASSASSSATLAATAQSAAETARDTAIDTAIVLGQDLMVEPYEQWTERGPSTGSTVTKPQINLLSNGSFVTNDSDFGNAFVFDNNVNYPIGPAFPMPYSDGRVIEIYCQYKVHDDGVSGAGQRTKLGVSIQNGTTMLQSNAQGGNLIRTVANGVIERTAWFYSSAAVVPTSLPANVEGVSVGGYSAANAIYPHVRQTATTGFDGGQTIGTLRVRDVTEVAKALKEAEDAASSAGAALTSEQAASASQTAAGQSAATATSEAQAASTSASNASASETAAASSATNAAGSASTATTQASLASVSAGQAQNLSQGGYISTKTFESGDVGFWVASGSPAVTVVNVPATHPLGRTKALRSVTRDVFCTRTDGASHTSVDGNFQESAHDRTFRVTGYVYNDGSVDAKLGIRSSNLANNNTSFPTGVAATSSQTGVWRQFSSEFTVSHTAGAQFIPFLQNNGYASNGDTLDSYWTDLDLVDITSEAEAEASAAAAAISESNATQSENNASGSASAALSSQTQAANSASAASGSASNAANSASQAAVSESNASGSATAAATSATTAATARSQLDLVDKGVSNAGFETDPLGDGIPSGWEADGQRSDFPNDIGMTSTVYASSSFGSTQSFGKTVSAAASGHWIRLSKYFVAQPSQIMNVEMDVFLDTTSTSANNRAGNWIDEDDVFVIFNWYDADGSSLSSTAVKSATSKYNNDNSGWVSGTSKAPMLAWFTYDCDTATAPANTAYVRIDIILIDDQPESVWDSTADLLNYQTWANGGNFRGYIDDVQFKSSNGAILEISKATLDAATSADAAATSASSAAASNTAAGQSASAAAGSELAASTSESNASTSESNAATSATNASGSASAAASSASLAASTQAASASRDFVPYFDPFVLGGGTSSSPTPGWRSASVKTGVTNPTTGSQAIAIIDGARQEPPYSFYSGQKIRVSFYYNSSAAIDNATVVLRAGSAGTLLSGFAPITIPHSSSGWVAVDQVVTIPSNVTNQCVAFDRITSTGDLLISDLSWIDVTESEAAADSASAALTSQQAAAVSESNAGTSASTASTQASNASTSAGNAATSASQAATSATNAAGSASSASTASGVAVTARDEALTEIAAGQVVYFSPDFVEAWIRGQNSAPIDSNDSRFLSGGTVATSYFTTSDATFGNAYIFSGTASNENVGPRRVYPWNNSKVYFVRAVYRITDNGTQSQTEAVYLGWDGRISGSSSSVWTNDQPFYHTTRSTSDGVIEIAGFFAGLDYTEAQLNALSIVANNKDVKSTLSGSHIPNTTNTADTVGFHIRQNAGSQSDGRIAVQSFEVTDVTDAVLAEIEADAAAGSASAANLSAQAASISESNAGTSASTASTQASNASTSAGQASTSASQAATSATNAAGSATSASSAQSLAVTARDAAIAARDSVVIQNLMPDSSFERAGVAGGFLDNSGYDPEVGRFSVVSSGTGSISPHHGSYMMKLTSSGATDTYANIRTFDINVASGDKFTLGAWVYNNTGGNVAIAIAQQGGWAQLSTTSNNQWTFYYANGTASANYTSLTVDKRSQAQTSSSEFYIDEIVLVRGHHDLSTIPTDDLVATLELDTSNNASAAATSAASATASNTAAGQSASAANQSALDAATSESNASTSESNASTSETNAAGSASSASTQAGNASTSASQAAGSASAASTSASAAATSASNAASSAAAAALDLRLLEARVTSGLNGHYVSNDWYLRSIDGAGAPAYVSALEDGVNIYIEKMTDGTQYTIKENADAYTNYNIPSETSQSGVGPWRVFASGPIICKHADGVMGAPANFSSLLLANSGSRYNPYDIYLFAPYGEAQVDVYYDANGAADFIESSSTVDDTITIPAGGYYHYEADVELSANDANATFVFKSDARITGIFRPTGGGDNMLMIPMSNGEVVSNYEASGEIVFYANSKTSGTPTRITNGSARYYATDDEDMHLAYYGHADGAGGDAEFGLPREALSDLYVWTEPNLSNYRIVAVEPCEITVMKADGTVLYRHDLSAASTSAPLFVSQGSSSGSTDFDTGGGPYRFVGTAPFHIVAQEGGDDDETVLLGARQARLGDNSVQAIAKQVNTVSSTVDGNTSSIQTQATSINGLEAQYTVKIDNAGHVSGYGLASTVVDGTPVAEFGVRADQFWIAPPATASNSAPTTNLYAGRVWVDTSGATDVTKYYTGSAWSTTPQNLPFVVQATPTTVNGEAVPAGVYIDAAYIKNGSITSARIGNAAIDDAKISDLSATKLTAGTIDASNISISGTNSSALNISSASSGARTVYTSTGIQIFDANGLRVKIGQL